MSIPSELRYTQEHEWIRDEGDGVYAIGITHFAQDALGDVVYCEVPEVGQSIELGQTFGVVESVKSVSDLFGPITGEIVERNESLWDTPEQINKDPYGVGWLIKVKSSDASELDALLDAAAYQAFVDSQSH